MKKRQVFGLVVAGLLAGFVSSAVAQSGAAYSSTAVGVIKKTLPAKKLALVSVPLDQAPIVDETTGDVIDGMRFSDIPGINDLPNGTAVNFWDVANQTWIQQVKTGKSGWGSQKDRIIKPGEAFFLNNDQDEAIQLIVSGEVPTDDSIPVAFAGNALTCVANPYPVARAFSELTFAGDLPDGSTANFWDEDSQTWIQQVKTGKTGWGSQKNRSIKPGEGFFIQASTDEYTWRETRLYSWPN